MAGSTYGTLFRITTWGESHGPAIGVVIDGCPSGLSLSEEDIQKQLDRRKPGQSKFTTKRNESDTVQILSGVFEGKTTGTPISVIVYNQDQRSRDYGKIKVTVPDMLIIHLMQNMASAITAVADVLLPVKQLAGSQPVQLQKKSWNN